jgi:hypothetical protein
LGGRSKQNGDDPNGVQCYTDAEWSVPTIVMAAPVALFLVGSMPKTGVTSTSITALVWISIRSNLKVMRPGLISSHCTSLAIVYNHACAPVAPSMSQYLVNSLVSQDLVPELED